MARHAAYVPAGPPAQLPDASPPAGLCMASQFYSEKAPSFICT